LSLAQINLSPGLPGPNRIKNVNLAISIVTKGYMFKKIVKFTNFAQTKCSFELHFLALF